VAPEDIYPLFEAYPALRTRLPRVVLAKLPTPVVRLRALEAKLGGPALWMKRDDLSSPVYGGNKTRKLELILGALERQGAARVITFGFAGSSHAAATALFCKERGIACVSMLMDEPVRAGLRENLLAGLGAGADLRLYPGLARLVLGAIAYRMSHRGPRGGLAPMIAAGGSTPEGNAAYVNAALELERQIGAGELEAPDEISVAAGSLGTAAGLLVGLRAAGRDGRVVAVRAVEARFASGAALARMARKTARFLVSRDPSFPRVGVDGARVEHGYFGGGTGAHTAEADAAVRLLEEAEGIRLEPAYTGKAFARFLAAARSPDARGKKLLFWNTCNAADLAPLAAATDPRILPPALRRYFPNA
jgi:1-aminocyclopropane-1-carboxylate deaminase/D-cysteine desulfhydrase-like pyridoxal-dependent ACC family enzyme